MRHRSSVLSLLDESCPRALDHARDGVPIDRRVVGGGISAHACLQGVGDALTAVGRSPADWDAYWPAVADSVCQALMSQGRSFDGGAPEVLTPEQTSTGRALAAGYLATHQLSHRSRYECGLAVDADMAPVPYDSPAARLIGILDMIHDDDISDEDGAGGIVRTAVDYKSSWRAGADWLESLQAKCQTVLLWAECCAAELDGEAPAGVRVAIVNLRTHARHEGDVLWLGDTASEDAVDRRWQEINLVMRAAEHEPRVADPGPRCLGCRYAHMCDDCFELASGVGGHRGASPADIAAMYASAVARAQALRPLVAEACGRGAIDVPGGSVGYRATKERKAKPDAPQALAREWLDGGEGTYDAFCGMLRALELGAGNVEALAKHLWPGRGVGRIDDFRERRAAFLARVLEERPGSEFGVWRQRGDVMTRRQHDAPVTG